MPGDEFDDSYRLELLRQAWPERRADLLPKWIAACPFSRPPAWWLIDAPEPRRHLGGGGSVHYRPGAGILSAPPPGCPRLHLKFREPEPIYESERDFLKRHRLLTDSEKRLSKS